MSRSAAAPSIGIQRRPRPQPGTCSAVLTDASRTPKTPSGNAPWAVTASVRASDVLPAPPGPTSDSNRAAGEAPK